MKDVSCYGIIPLKLVEGDWQVLLIKHKRGDYWAFPKGHGEFGESPHQSASRELMEETGQSIVRYLSEKSIQEHYHFILHGEPIHKTVTYFLAEVMGELRLQEKEISDAKWIALALAEAEMSFKEGKNLCRRSTQLLADISFHK